MLSYFPNSRNIHIQRSLFINVYSKMNKIGVPLKVPEASF